MEANIVFFIFLGILCLAKMAELNQEEDFMEDSPLGSWNEENDDSNEEAPSSYSSSRKPKPKKSSRDYKKTCKELATFVPDLCTYGKAKERCHKYCEAGKTQPGKKLCPFDKPMFRVSFKCTKKSLQNLFRSARRCKDLDIAQRNSLKYSISTKSDDQKLENFF